MLRTFNQNRWKRVASNWAVVALLILIATPCVAQEPEAVHYWHHGVMPPGAIGGRQLQRGGPLAGFFQPVEIKTPPGVFVSMAKEGAFEEPTRAPIRAGLLIGQVYRFRVMGIRLHPGVEVFPTVEVIDRLYTPADQSVRFAIPIELIEEDIIHALQGKLVTRVIYLENPQNPLPVAERRDPTAGEYFDVGPNRDPLAAADQLGRPVAILRMGARMPNYDTGPDMQFLFGCPPWVKLPQRRKTPKPQPAAPAAPEPAPAPAGGPAEPAPAPAGGPAEPAPAPAPLEPVPVPAGAGPVPAPPVPAGGP